MTYHQVVCIAFLYVLCVNSCFRCYFILPVDHELEVDTEYLNEQYDYPAEQGKRKSPIEHLWSYIFPQVFYSTIILACDSNIVLGRLLELSYMLH